MLTLHTGELYGLTSMWLLTGTLPFQKSLITQENFVWFEFDAFAEKSDCWNVQNILHTSTKYYHKFFFYADSCHIWPSMCWALVTCKSFPLMYSVFCLYMFLLKRDVYEQKVHQKNFAMFLKLGDAFPGLAVLALCSGWSAALETEYAFTYPAVLEVSEVQGG